MEGDGAKKEKYSLSMLAVFYRLRLFRWGRVEAKSSRTCFDCGSLEGEEEEDLKVSLLRPASLRLDC